MYTENDRLAALSAHNLSKKGKAKYAPGTHGCHEALHVASVIEGMIDANLVNHPAVLLDPEIYRLAAAAHKAMFDLYQAIGARHMSPAAK